MSNSNNPFVYGVSDGPTTSAWGHQKKAYLQNSK
jgi:hypothetical protein